MATTQVVTRPNRVLDIGLGIGVVVLAVVGYLVVGSSSGSAAPTIRTTTVARGAVLSSVQASGNVQAGTTYSVGFQTGGTVTDIDVSVGDHVTQGESLAHLNPNIAAAGLASAQAGLASAQANLAQAENPLTSADQAQNASAVASAQSALSAAQQSAQLDAEQAQAAVDAAQSKLSTDQANNAPANTISQDQSALTNAQNQQSTGALKDQEQVANAQNQLNGTLASNAAKAQPQPAQVAQAKASVTQAQAQLLSAQQTMSYTTLTAPADGVVTQINGVVNQTVSGGGTSAAQNSTTAGASSSGGGSSSGSSSGSSGSSSAFMQITNTGSLTVKAGFAETDATKLAVGQPATVTFNALPNVQAAGVVTEVDTNSTLVSNVVTYYALVTLNSVPPTVKPGMTASVTVIIAKRDDVLNVPSAAVRGSGNTGTVTILNGKQQTTATVGVGLRGDTTTEITQGVTQGQTLVLPNATVSGAASQLGSGTGRFNFGGGGLGGGGLGGGFGGRGGGGGGTRGG
jgi:multidrug efflux pump subunit AcrA (membrane-fusion protein)